MNSINQSYIRAKELLAKKIAQLPSQKHNEYDRLPPGQRLVQNFPILDLGYQPMFFEKKYRFEVVGAIDNPVSLTWKELLALPKTEFTADFHCVTRWSKFDVKWGGIKMEEILNLVKPSENAKFVLQYGSDGYMTNVPLDKLARGFLAYELFGEPLPRKQGGPIRVIIPELYAWKGSKFITKLEFLTQDHPGFWEVRGYHNDGDPWKEERYG